MANSDCKQNTDASRLAHEGRSRDLRVPKALDPNHVPVNERGPEYGLVFAKAYSAYLNYYDPNNSVTGDWQSFFDKDVSVLLAVAAIQDVDAYRSAVKAYFDFLNNSGNRTQAEALKQRVGFLFSIAATMAKRLDRLKENLPVDTALKNLLQNRIRSQSAQGFKRLIAYYKAYESDFGLTDDELDVAAELTIFGQEAQSFGDIYRRPFSKDWIIGNFPDWPHYIDSIVKDAGGFGPLLDPSNPNYWFSIHNSIASHNLFTSIFDDFLKIYARIVVEAKQELENSFIQNGNHEPHYALLIAFLRLFEGTRAEINTLTGRHLDFYYRDILQLKEKPAEPPRVHLLAELAKHADSHRFDSGVSFKAGKDESGIEAFFTNDRDFIANKAKVAELKTVYRHGGEAVTGLGVNAAKQSGRYYASPVADSEDGLGAKLTNEEQSWHPFFNKRYSNALLESIAMPEAELGFAIASHYLWLAEGDRIITLEFQLSGSPAGNSPELKNAIVCQLTGEDDWFEITATTFVLSGNSITFELRLDGADPAVTPYSEKVHARGFKTSLPVLMIRLKHRADSVFAYETLRDPVIASIQLSVDVKGVRSLAVSNDFGTVDLSKPFQPFGARPVNGNRLTIGSSEVFQKRLDSAKLYIEWQNPPSYYPPGGLLLHAYPIVFNILESNGEPQPPFTASQMDTTLNIVQSGVPTIGLAYLKAGQWQASSASANFAATEFDLTDTAQHAFHQDISFANNAVYRIDDVNGFVRLIFQGDFGFDQYLTDLTNFLTDQEPKPDSHPGAPPVGPFIEQLIIDYRASQAIMLNSALPDAMQQREVHFFHIGPFGQAEQHPALNTAKQVNLLPQFGFMRDELTVHSEAECYIGIDGLEPPQNLSLLFQVADGTADPLTIKPDPHIHWNYLRGNEWIAFKKDEVEDGTGGLLNSGIIRFALPNDADNNNSILPPGMHWLRAAVASHSEAVCRLQAVSAQALQATFSDRGNDPGFSAKPLKAGTISQLERPNAAVKKIEQPFSSFGGRGAETPAAFYTRVSERLRHKDRAVALWDYEHLVLEAFPQIYRVKCLNHTQYEPGENGDFVYRELAPGHVTLVAIPNLRFQTYRDPLKPYTSLGLLDEIKDFLSSRVPCFVNLHVRNPRFETVHCSCKVRFHEGFDETFYRNTLRQAITRFLSPWAFANDAKPSFGGKIHQSVLIRFIEEQTYVDYLTDFVLYHDSGGTAGEVAVHEAAGSTAASILVSAPAGEHQIDVIKPAAVHELGETCPCEP
ncbi:baseplate J/gp47 family protein [Methylotuvimicrobium buryatense]|uniref:Uncharacterized protein n=1 Tax=Methylotuvimicrobium buryatense TaxID=95641 RepID=A0A4P9UMW6_METBY|nr:baseplate J/gp47 family protein [Methylotuvimicrobium buryatense]QCW82692.1 hypothetical protein EQU24_10930 [Methylotuvimicrobium buryatense]